VLVSRDTKVGKVLLVKKVTQEDRKDLKVFKVIIEVFKVM
jgi:hypothetical protein